MAHHNYSPPTTPFVGRAQEIAEISERLSDVNCRLLTVLGPGGIGKTRLALEVAERMHKVFPEGVYLVNFQSISSTDVLVATVSDALNLPVSNQEQLQTHLFKFLNTREVLLILDNLEHLLNGVAWISDLLVNAPRIKLLSTSRAALKLREEWLYPIRGLPYPMNFNDSDFKQYAAVQVFLQTARRVQPNFSVANEREGVLRICRLTEGIPLAIEMAASWVKVLPCQKIADEMQHNLDLLMVSTHNVPERHRSMRAVFNHTWQLLNEDERWALMRLSVFQGGFTLDAAEVVAGASLPVIALLIEKSLLRRLSLNRFSMHELLRQFVQQKFAAMPEDQEVTQARYCGYFVEFLHRLAGELRTMGEYDALTAIEDELDNIRGCWEKILQRRDIESLKKCVDPMQVFYHVRDRSHEGERVFNRAIEVISEEAPGLERDVTLGLLLMGLGKCCMRIGQMHRSKQLLQESVTILDRCNAERELGWARLEQGCTLQDLGEYRAAIRAYEDSRLLGESVGDEALVAWSYFDLSYSVRMDGRFTEALRLMEEGAIRIRKTGDEDGIGLALRGLADRYLEFGEYSKAKHLYLESLAIHQKLGYKTRLAMTFDALGKVHFALGDYHEAHQLMQQSLAIARVLGSPRRLGFALIDLGHLALATGKVEGAQSIFEESLSITLQAADSWQQALALRGLGRVAFTLGQYIEAYRLFQESLALCQKNDFRLEIGYSLNYVGQAASVLGKRPEARQHFCDALQIGLEIQIVPLLLEIIFGIATLLRAEDDYAQAIALLSLVLDHPASHQEMKDHAVQDLDQLKSRTSANMYATASKRGQSMTLEPTAAALLAEFSIDERPAPAQSVVDPLSDRELEVLHLIANGLTNRQIASKLIIAEGTVKWYTTQIYGKLGVKNRAQAIRRAQVINLLP